MSTPISLSQSTRTIQKFVGADDAHVSEQSKFFSRWVFVSGRLERIPADLFLAMYCECFLEIS